jgi:carboxymethylenebutenolidase
VQEIFGLSPWIRGVADQLAADGYIAIAPDFLSPQADKPYGWPDSVSMQDGIAATSNLNPDNVQRWIDAAAQYAMAQPAALKKYGVVGFCWGGGQAFLHAVHSPTLSAAVVYYGTSPTAAQLASVRAPVLGFYGGNDARVTTTVPPADSTMQAMHKTFEPHVYAGAGHGFLRQQSGENGANLKATQQAWPATLAWFRQYLARDATSHS